MKQSTFTVYGHADDEAYIIVAGAQGKLEAKSMAVPRLRGDGFQSVTAERAEYSGKSKLYSWGDVLRVA